MRHEVGAHGGVPVRLFGVVADDEPDRAGSRVAVALAAGGDVDFLHPEVVGHGLVPAGTGQRRGSLGVGVAQLLSVDVMPTPARQVGPVGL